MTPKHRHSYRSQSPRSSRDSKVRRRTVVVSTRRGIIREKGRYRVSFFATGWYGRSAPMSSANRHDECRGPAADNVWPASGAARGAIEIDAKLAQRRDFGSCPWVGHAMHHAQRRAAEMTDTGFDQISRGQIASATLPFFTVPSCDGSYPPHATPGHPARSAPQPIRLPPYPRTRYR